MNTIKTGLLGLAIGFLSVSCGSSDDDDGATAATGGRAALPGGAGGSSAGTGARGGATAGGGTTAGGGNTTTGGTATTGGASTGGAPDTGGSSTGGDPATGGASATGGSGGTPSGDETCTKVCKLLESTTLTCVPSPCADTCATKYNAVAATSAACGDAYLALLNCGLTKPADSWLCYAIPTTTTSIPVPPYSSGAPDGCQTEFNALISAVLGNMACVTALMS